MHGCWGCWMDWWAHKSSNLSCMHQFALKGCSPCHSDTESKGYKVADYPVNLQTTKSNQLRVTQDNLGHMQLNKWRTLPCKVVLSLIKRHWSSHDRGSVASQEVTWMYSFQKTQMISLELMCAPLIYPQPSM